MDSFFSLRKKVLDKTFSKLNDMQKIGVYTVNGPVLILAGAGSGKTTVLVNRIANMIRFGNAYNSDKIGTIVSDDDLKLIERFLSDDESLSEEDKQYIDELVAVDPIRPWNILAITFTNKAANELKDRLVNMLGERGNDVNAGTFHSACVRILRREIEKIGYASNFTIYDSDDSKRVIKECLKELRIEEKIFPVKQVMNEISRAKDKLITPEEFSQGKESDYYAANISRIYTLYQQKVKAANAVDFDDIIVLTVRLFESNSDVLEHYRNRFKYIMVDEYQDTNMAQYKLISLLTDGVKNNLCVVGDDDQSIYGFRGATIQNILSFENQFNNAKVIRLEQNYRSTQNILDAANAVIKNNTERMGKNLWTAEGAGDKIVQYRCDDERKEAEFVTEKIMDHAAQNKPYSDCAILYRTNSQSNNFERSFVKSGIPYRIIGGHRFYERMEIKDIVAYLCVINNPDDSLRLERIINQPKRGIGDSSVAKAMEIAESLGQSLFDTICTADEYPDIKRSSKGMCEFGKMMKHLIDKSTDIEDLGDFVCEVIELSGYDTYLMSLGEEGKTRAENVQELVNTMTRYSEENPGATLSEYLEEVSLMTDIDNYDADADTVVMMTIHSAKGLEFNNVFMVGMDEGVFPGIMSMDSPKELQEERRLAYVGVTRARKKLYLTSCAKRMLYGKTQINMISRFAKEIPNSVKEVIDECYTESPFSSGYSDRSFRTSGGDFYSGSRGNISSFSGTQFGTSSFASNKEKPKAAKLDLNVGDTVMHRVFGEGMIVSMTPMAGDTLLEISFDRVGTKKIMANYAKITKK